MCGRFTQHFTWKELVELYNLTRLDNAPNLQPRSDIRPTTDIVIVREVDGEREAATVHWWLVPPWAKELSQKYAMFNARAETLTQRKAFAGPFRKRRCLIPASGFYEWKDEGGKRKTRYYITSKSGQPLTFAGLWEHNPHLELDSCTIIVTEPNALMAEIHDRMPVILPPEAHDAWMAEPRMELLRPAPAEGLVAYPVKNDIRDDDPPSVVANTGEDGKPVEDTQIQDRQIEY